MKTPFLKFLLALATLIFIITSCDPPGGANECSPSSFKAMDLVINARDLNDFPKNPKWRQQVDSGKNPNPVDFCPNHAESNEPSNWNSYPYCNCTSHIISITNSKRCDRGHANYESILYEGVASFSYLSDLDVVDDEDDPDDADININIRRNDDALATVKTQEDGYSILGEFDAREFLMSNNFNNADLWWKKLHDISFQSDEEGQSFFKDKQIIAAGMLGLDVAHFNDGGHDGGHAELHPIYAIFVHVKDTLNTEHWAFFVRNWGNEGNCGGDNVPLYMQDLSFLIPCVDSLVTSIVCENGTCTDDKLMYWNYEQIGRSGGMKFNFHLKSPSEKSFFIGDLYLKKCPTFERNDKADSLQRYHFPGPVIKGKQRRHNESLKPRNDYVD